MIDYSDNLSILCQLEGSVLPAAALQALPGTIFALLLCFLEEWSPANRRDSGWADLNFVGLTWNAITASIGILLALRIKQALGRFWEGTSLLHQMRGEWFDAASCLITFSRDAMINKGKRKEVEEFRSTLVRLMSLMHGSALDEISDSGIGFEVIDVGGLDTDTLVFLRDCQTRCSFSKVEALQHLIQVLVTDNHQSGVLSIPPPILSRCYQTLSRGFVNLLNARKIKDTMFPFPFVQTIKALIVVHTFISPAVMTTVFDTNFWSVLFTFLSLFGLHCLNLTAWQLEMPFGADPNDLPLGQFQQEMNSTLLMLVSAGADHCPGQSHMAACLVGDLVDVGSLTHSESFEKKPFFWDLRNMQINMPSLIASRSPQTSILKASGTNSSLPGRRSQEKRCSTTTRSFLDKDFFKSRSSLTLASSSQLGLSLASSPTNHQIREGTRASKLFSTLSTFEGGLAGMQSLAPWDGSEDLHSRIKGHERSNNPVCIFPLATTPQATLTPRRSPTTPGKPLFTPRGSPRFAPINEVGLDLPITDNDYRV